MSQLTPQNVAEALQMLREQYRAAFTEDMRASGLGHLTPAAAVTQLMAAPRVEEFLAAQLNKFLEKDRG